MSTPAITRATVLRLYPNQQQASSLRRWQGGLRYVWNAALDCVFTSRDINGRWPMKAEFQTLIVVMKKMEGTDWISDIPAHCAGFEDTVNQKRTKENSHVSHGCLVQISLLLTQAVA